jgi:hypothetical protein
MPFGLFPFYLLSLLFVLAILVGAAFAIGWGFRKGWDAARPAEPAPTDVQREP